MKSLKQLFKEALVRQAGTQYGSNPGGVYVDSNNKNKKFYVKSYKNPDQAKVEALTAAISAHMGIKTINPEYKEIEGRPSVVTPWNDSLRGMKPKEFENLSTEQAKQIGRMHAAATLTKNWDIVGLEHDNIMKHENGDLYSVDQGGSFNFRARGGPKEYGPDIAERESLVNNREASGHVFRTTFSNHPEARQAGIEAVRNIDHEHVKNLFKESGLDNWEELHKNFVARTENFLKGS